LQASETDWVEVEDEEESDDEDEEESEEDEVGCALLRQSSLVKPDVLVQGLVEGTFEAMSGMPDQV
jgi:hypothetical protein